MTSSCVLWHNQLIATKSKKKTNGFEVPLSRQKWPFFPLHNSAHLTFDASPRPPTSNARPIVSDFLQFSRFSYFPRLSSQNPVPMVNSDSGSFVVYAHCSSHLRAHACPKKLFFARLWYYGTFFGGSLWDVLLAPGWVLWYRLPRGGLQQGSQARLAPQWRRTGRPCFSTAALRGAKAAPLGATRVGEAF